MADFSADERKKLAKKGAAMSDGSFPIRNASDLANAIQALGRAKDPDAARRHIIKRARALGLTKSLPDSWNVTEAWFEPEPEALVEPLAEAGGAPSGKTWRVRIIRKGVSKNKRRYPEAVLREAVGLFEGARVLARSDQAHVRNEDTSVEKIVGWVEKVAYERDGVYGDLNILESAAWLRTLLMDAWNRNKRDIVGLSIVAEGEGQSVVENGSRLYEVSKITRVRSVDVVVDPAAGGELTRLVAAEDQEGGPGMAEEETELTAEQLAEKFPDAVKALEDAARESVKAEFERLDAEEKKKAEEKAAEQEKVSVEAESDLVPTYLAESVVEITLGRTKLPEVSRKRIHKRFDAGGFRSEDLSEAVHDEVEMWAEIEKSNGTRISEGTERVEVGTDEKAKALAALDGMFQGHDVELDGEKIPRYRSIREAYIDLTGDEHVTGELPRRMAESRGKLGLSLRDNGLVQVPVFAESETGELLTEAGEIVLASWGEILGDSITRRAVQEYKEASDLQQWQPLVDERPVSDFRTQRITRLGGYADLAAVAELGPYVDMTSPADEEATYAATKRGGIDVVSLEVIANDDLNYVRRLPVRMGRAAARTKMKFVLDFIRTNPTIYDGVALFHASHGGNLLATVLSVSAFNVARQVMRTQSEAGSSEVLGIVPKHLFVPNELEQLAYEITLSDRKPGTADNDANFARSQGVAYHVVDYWTDATDWAVTADKSDIPLIELGYFGPAEPQIFTQDMPNVGSMFNNDSLTYKIRHIYGGAVIDFRGFIKSVQ